MRSRGGSYDEVSPTACLKTKLKTPKNLTTYFVRRSSVSRPLVVESLPEIPVNTRSCGDTGLDTRDTQARKTLATKEKRKKIK